MRAGFASSATKSYRRVFEKRSGAFKASEQLCKSFKVPPRKSWIEPGETMVSDRNGRSKWSAALTFDYSKWPYAGYLGEHPYWMKIDDQEDSTGYKVVVNHEEQYSIWPADRETPLGWRDAGKRGNKAECLAYIKQVWTDLTPLSLRKSMDSKTKEG